MTGLRQLLGSTATYISANVVNSAIPFLLLPVLTRVLTPAEYGTVTMFTTAISVLSAFTGLSMHGAVSVRYFDKDTDHPRFVGTCLAILASSTALVLLAVWLLAAQLARWTEVPQGWLLLAVLGAAIQSIIQIRLVMWQVKNKAVHYGVFQISQTMLNLALSLGLILTVGMGWEGRTLGIVIAIFIFGALALYSLQSGRLVRWQWDVEYAKASLRFGVPLISHSMGGMMIAMSDRFVVTSILGVKEMGIYAAAMQVGSIIGFLADAGNRAFAPWLFQVLSCNDPNINARIILYTYLLFVIMPLVALLFGATAPVMLKLMVGERYRDSADVVLYIAMGGAFGGMYYLVANYVFFSEKTGWLAAATLISGVVNVAMTWWLVNAHGAVGAAQAYMLAQVLCFLVVWVLAARSHPMPWGIVGRGAKSFLKL